LIRAEDWAIKGAQIGPPQIEGTAMQPAKMTHTPRTDEIERDRAWFIVDAQGKVLGRVAAQIAHVLRGKHKPSFTPHLDVGDFVIVVNAGGIRVTGRKLEQKQYHRHTGYVGHIKTATLAHLLDTHPERVIEGAVRGMLPKNSLGRRMLRKLKVYADPGHPHAAQRPAPLEVKA
jgi:large subunit ribosomal protein L13